VTKLGERTKPIGRKHDSLLSNRICTCKNTHNPIPTAYAARYYHNIPQTMHMHCSFALYLDRPNNVVCCFPKYGTVGNHRQRVQSATQHFLNRWSGNLTGTYVEGTRTSEVQGFWDEASKKITFVRTLDNPSNIQIFTGYLFDTGATFCQVGDIHRMLAGSFEAFSSTGGSAQRSVFGWAAKFCLVG
jgi:hypothetical protein